MISRHIGEAFAGLSRRGRGKGPGFDSCCGEPLQHILLDIDDYENDEHDGGHKDDEASEEEGDEDDADENEDEDKFEDDKNDKGRRW